MLARTPMGRLGQPEDISGEGAAVVLLWCCCGAAVVLLWCCCGAAVVL